MPERHSLASTPQPCTTPRRSPRFLHPTTTPQPPKLTTPPRKPRRKPAAESENPKTPKSKLRRNEVRSLDCGVIEQNDDGPEMEQGATVLRKSRRLLELKERAEELGNTRTPKSKSGGKNAVRSLNLSVELKKLSRGNAGSRVLNRQVVVLVSDDEDEDSSPERVSKKLGRPLNGRGNGEKLRSGSRKDRRLNNGSDALQARRRSSRLGGKQNVVEKQIDKGKSGKSTSERKILLDKEKASGVNSGKSVSAKSKRVSKKSSVGSGVGTARVECGEGKGGELDCRDKKVAVRRKRKRGEDDVKVAKGWTKEQELALQRAYLLAKPTPGFWKQVAKLVPGKSAQDCFDRIHSDHVTPPQPRPRSRAKIATNSSPLGGFSLSASKLLNPIESKPKRHGCNKQRSHLAQKTVRALLHKHYQVHQEFEADLFSVLEPSVGPSTETPQPSVIPSTPINSQVKQKIPLSRFSNPSETSLVSPPVLKQVKNKALHEKYIDQLHIREAKRETLAKITKKSTCGIDDTKKSHIQKVDLRTAKIALVSDARDAINKLKHLQENSLESDDEEVQRDDEEDEDETL
ncbi:uncharacterized protein LOC126794106 [Argentina anserina]|uniref:uncharacterized protein LOC126794106 n=1 Tax=Argentina anserina TaxID=57926 RepID=UPI0021767458|nr:uncharacterized protein LOC126794106 [Potentilla anserina]